MPRNTSVTLGEHFEHFIAEKIAEGRFYSVSEMVRAGLRRLEEEEMKLKRLKEKLQSGENSPIAADFDSRAFVEKMHKKYVK